MGNKAAKLSPKTVEQLQKHMNVDFTSQEIKDWYQEYQKSLSSGETQLSRDDFKRVYDKMFSGDATSFAEQVFRSFDINGNGYVDFQEFIVGLSISSSPNNETKWAWAFSMYDIDGDGFISREEMSHIMKAIFSMAEFKLPKGYKTTDEYTDDIFKSIDTNQDGLISQEEFINGAKTNPVIIDLLQPNPEADDDNEDCYE
ncbi:hypothetical protein FSP39_011964 [Pinctada imbricata]|uniref:EF-hand domain-containing protein n=1 Tax=Pinctada imbricata TaxID=66713 RepID=A0AA88XQL7_PINIB|nr:hypothetical protein FSP39_011964 [Pinctada imbricata]